MFPREIMFPCLAIILENACHSIACKRRNHQGQTVNRGRPADLEVIRVTKAVVLNWVESGVSNVLGGEKIHCQKMFDRDVRPKPTEKQPCSTRVFMVLGLVRLCVWIPSR